MTGLKLAAPWTIFYREVEAMFKLDKEIEVKYDEENGVINILCTNSVKAEALSKILPTEKTFGNVTLKINIKVINSPALDITVNEIMEDALVGNEALSRIVKVTNIFGIEYNYVVFKPIIAQFYNDNLADINGLCHTLYENIAKDIFETGGQIFFCTERID